MSRKHEGIFLSQKKFILICLMKQDSMAKTVDTPLEAGVKLMPDEGQEVEDPSKNRRLVGKLIYLTITRPNISFADSLVGQFVQNPMIPHDCSV